MGKRFLYFIIESAIPGGAEYELEIHFLIRSLLDVFAIYIDFLLNVNRIRMFLRREVVKCILIGSDS